jgi:hypothetical protein
LVQCNKVLVVGGSGPIDWRDNYSTVITIADRAAGIDALRAGAKARLTFAVDAGG